MNLFKHKLINNSVSHQGIWTILKRFKSNKTAKSAKTGPTYAALKHFDNFYKALFEEKWPSVRLALLSEQKRIAVINNFGEVEKTEKLLENLGAFDLKLFFEAQKSYVKQPCIEYLPKENKAELDEVIQKRFLEEEEKELQLLHPEGKKMEFQDVDEKNEKIEDFKDHIYNREEDTSSLMSHMKAAQIDTERMIMPELSTQLSNLDVFMPTKKLRGVNDFIPESEYFKYYKVKPSSSIIIEDELELDFPENLKVYSFDRGEILDFPEPKRCVNNVYNYLKMDGAELLATLALGVQPSDIVLDMCSTSENIAYCIFQSLRTKLLVCTNDIQGKSSYLFNEYLFDDFRRRKEILLVTSSTVDEIENAGLFDKILVDVPSTFDRSSLFEIENNPFHELRLRKRLRLPELQCSLLLKGLQLVRPGGTVLYTTSTLSPIQNDGVVYEALNIALREHGIACTVKNLSPALGHTTLLFNYGDYLNLKYGTLVVPFVPSNFGPRYMCKIIKNEATEKKI